MVTLGAVIMEIIIVHVGYSSTTFCTEGASRRDRPDDIQNFQRYHRYDEYNEPIMDFETTITFTCSRVVWPIILERIHSCNNCPQSLVIEHSNLGSVPPSSFMEFSFLTSLDMEEQHIERLVPGALNYLSYLQFLNLSGNSIRNIGVGVFNSLYKLESLDLSRNKINFLEKHSLTGMAKLQYLNISQNTIMVFGDSIMDSAMTLRRLDLSFNNISKFEFHSIDAEDINLNNNVLDTVNFCPSGHLRKLSLSTNLIKSLTNIACDTSSDLQDLDLSSNKISDLDPVLFNNSNGLRRLSLSYNNISFIPPGFLSTSHDLIYLNLSHNKLVQFKHGTFEALVGLDVLDISHNSLRDLKRYLHALSNLRELYVDHNELVILDSRQLLKDSPLLSKISITTNNMTCENLIEIKHDIKDIQMEYGGTKNSSNIHGISCSEKPDSVESIQEPAVDKLLGNVNAEFEKILINKLSKISGDQDFRKSAIYDYFNKDFEDSNFYKYMENLQKLSSFKLNESKLLDFFDKDFENTKFFKYLESLKNIENATSGDLNRAVYNYFNSDFKNSNFVKYLDELSVKTDEMINGGFSKSAMYNFFNKNFENTMFYKFLSNLQNPIQTFKPASNQSESRYERLTYNSPEPKNSDNQILPLMIFIILIIICINSLMLSYLKYRNSIKILSGTHDEHVEMI